MPRYMLFITHSEHYRNQAIPKALNDAMGEFINENLKSGVLVDTNGFAPIGLTLSASAARRAPITS